MKKALLLLLLFVGAIQSVAAPKAAPNIVYEQLTETYRFVPDKNGNLAKVEINGQATFRANRVADKAGFTLYYNSTYLSLDKASGDDVTYKAPQNEELFYTDVKSCHISVNLKKKGAQAKASYKRTYTKPEFLTHIYMGEFYPIENGAVILEMPESMSSRYSVEAFNLTEHFTRSEERKDGKLIIRYSIKDFPELKIFEDAPDITLTAPRLEIRGHFKDADDIYRYLRSYTLNEDPGQATVEAKAREITAGCTTDSERISAILDFVHNTVRYVAVEHGEFGHRPDLPSEVLRKAYGDCKCSAGLIKAMLKAVGIDGRLAWLGIHEQPVKWTDDPNISTGNHMIAAAMTGDSIMFLDGTAKSCPAGMLPSTLYGCQILVEDNDEKCIIKDIPEDNPERNSLDKNMTVKIQPDDNLEIEGSMIFKGYHFTGFKSMLLATPTDKRQETCDRLFRSAFKGSHTLQTVFNERADSLVIDGKLTLGSAVKRADDEIYVDLNPDDELQELKFITEDRNVSGKIGRSGARKATLKLILPEGMEIADLPRPVEIDNDYFRGKVTTIPSSDGRSVTRTYSMTVKQRIVPLEEIDKFNADINLLNRACSAKTVLKSKQ